MKTNLFDKNKVELQIGDRYITEGDKEYAYIVYYKGGAVCGGISEDVAVPLCWEINIHNTDCNGTPIDLTYSEDLNWLEII